MTNRRRLIRVPASSANLGPGYDVFAAALHLHLELEVAEADEFAVEIDGAGELPRDRTNLIVRAFERLHPADGIVFRTSSEIPPARGLGSSAAAIVAGLLAADHLFELGLSREQLYHAAVEIEGHPDNVAAALYGGFVCCPRGDRGSQPPPVLLAPPDGVEAVLVIPEQAVPTAQARAAMPAAVPLADALANLAAASQLIVGIERSDLGLIARGLEDRLHQPARRGLYPRSLELLERASELGALGATISGAGPTLLIWSFWQDTGKVLEAAREAAEGWAEARRLSFSPLGGDVVEL